MIEKQKEKGGNTHPNASVLFGTTSISTGAALEPAATTVQIVARTARERREGTGRAIAFPTGGDLEIRRFISKMD